MSNLMVFVVFTIVCFVVVGIAIAIFKRDAIFTISIGTVIGANVYNIGAYPIEIGNLTFGIDGVVYCIFLFCLLVMFLDYEKKEMNLVLYTALFSIFFTALLSFFGTYFVSQNWADQVWSTISYLFSIIATYVAVVLMIRLFEVLKEKTNKLFLIGICILIGNLINSIIYFGLTFLVTGSLGTNFVYAFIGSTITKFVCTIVCVLYYFFYEKYWNKKTTI